MFAHEQGGHMSDAVSEGRPNLLTYALIVGGGALVAGALGYWLKSNLVFVSVDDAGTWLDPFWGRFQIMFVVAVLIERSVEVYLKATDKNGVEYYDFNRNTFVKTRDASQAALLVALIIGVLVAISGIRIIETLVTLTVAPGSGFWNGFVKSSIWYGIDILVSAGLMAGGADVMHKVAEVLVGGLDRLKLAVRGEARGGIPARVAATASAPSAMYSSLAAAKSYTVRISRPKGADVEEGTLDFTDGGVTIQAKCWWDKSNRIDAGTYTKCSKTHMDSPPKIEAIYLPDAVSKKSGKNEIFVHRGESPANSLGCIAVHSDSFATLWNHLAPLNGFNITVIVSDT
jgi:hypothetical protein